jgi:transposase
VLSPVHLAKSAKQKKNKTDAKDARHLFEDARGHVLAGNELPIVWPPPRLLRNDRELIRARLETAEAGTALKLQILALLKRQGCAPPQKHNWSKAFGRWLKDLAARLPQSSVSNSCSSTGPCASSRKPSGTVRRARRCASCQGWDC